MWYSLRDLLEEVKMSFNRLFRTFHVHKLVLVALAALALTVVSLPVAAQDNQIPPKVIVNAGGKAKLTSPPPEGGAARNYPLEFAIIAGSDEDGTNPRGYINFVFGKAFSRDWGAVPPNDAMYLAGKITEITEDAEGVIHLKGTLTEVDFTHGQGVVFLIDDLFDIKVGGNFGTKGFILQWCLLPAFPVRVTHGVLTVNPL
jgi:hypothetical protein